MLCCRTAIRAAASWRCPPGIVIALCPRRTTGRSVELNITTDSYTSSDDDAVARAGVRAGAEVVRAMYSQRLSPIDKGAGNFVTAVDRGGREDDPQCPPCRTACGARRGRRPTGHRRCAPVVGGSSVRHAELRCHPTGAHLLAPDAADFHQGGESPSAAGRRLRVLGRRLPR